MNWMKRILSVCAVTVLLPVFAADQGHKPAEIQDTRLVVEFPNGVKQAMLERMRRNLSDTFMIFNKRWRNRISSAQRTSPNSALA
jgi:hypothetical protein